MAVIPVQHHADSQYTIYVEHKNRQGYILPCYICNKWADNNKDN